MGRRGGPAALSGVVGWWGRVLGKARPQKTGCERVRSPCGGESSHEACEGLLAVPLLLVK